MPRPVATYMIANTIRSLQPSSDDQTCQRDHAQGEDREHGDRPGQETVEVLVGDGLDVVAFQSRWRPSSGSFARHRKIAPRSVFSLSCPERDVSASEKAGRRAAQGLRREAASAASRSRSPLRDRGAAFFFFGFGFGSVTRIVRFSTPSGPLGPAPRSAAGSGRAPAAATRTCGVPRGELGGRARGSSRACPTRRTLTVETFEIVKRTVRRAVAADPRSGAIADPRRLALVALEALAGAAVDLRLRRGRRGRRGSRRSASGSSASPRRRARSTATRRRCRTPRPRAARRARRARTAAWRAWSAAARRRRAARSRPAGRR